MDLNPTQFQKLTQEVIFARPYKETNCHPSNRYGTSNKTNGTEFNLHWMHKGSDTQLITTMEQIMRTISRFFSPFISWIPKMPSTMANLPRMSTTRHKATFNVQLLRERLSVHQLELIFVWSQALTKSRVWLISTVAQLFGIFRSEAHHSTFYNHSHNLKCIFVVVMSMTSFQLVVILKAQLNLSSIFSHIRLKIA